MSHPVQVLHRGRFYDIDGAVAEPIAANAWEIRIPADDGIHERTRRKPTAEGWDDAVFLVDGQETQPAVGSAESAREVRVTAFVL